MRIRAGTDTDAAAAAIVVQQVLHEHGLPFDPSFLDADILTPETHFGRNGGAFFVAVDGCDRVVGTAALKRTGVRTGEVRKLFLAPEARGLGAGRALLDAVLDAARERGLDRLTLTTRARFHRAIRLYERVGFRPTGVLPPPRGGDPGLTYELDLAAERVPGRPGGFPRHDLLPVLAA